MLYENFLNNGAKLQDESMNMREAKMHYTNSCMRCCLRGYHIDCENCQIKNAHSNAQDRLQTKPQCAHA